MFVRLTPKVLPGNTPQYFNYNFFGSIKIMYDIIDDPILQDYSQIHQHSPSIDFKDQGFVTHF